MVESNWLQQGIKTQREKPFFLFLGELRKKPIRVKKSKKERNQKLYKPEFSVNFPPRVMFIEYKQFIS